MREHPFRHVRATARMHAIQHIFYDVIRVKLVDRTPNFLEFGILWAKRQKTSLVKLTP